jgi:hypothetical protein
VLQVTGERSEKNDTDAENHNVQMISLETDGN